MLTPTIILSFVIVITFLPSFILSQSDSEYYDRCSPFQCGNITFPFPFSPLPTVGCGPPGYQIGCDELLQVPKLFLSGILYHVKNLFPSDRLITVVDYNFIQDLRSGTCDSLRNLSISGVYGDSLGLPPGWNANLTFFKCNTTESVLSQEFLDKVVINYTCGEGSELYLWRNGTQKDPPSSLGALAAPSGCSLVMVPVSGRSQVFFNISNGRGGTEELARVLSDGFPLQWNSSAECESCGNITGDGGGRCGFNGTGIVCLCRGGCKVRSLKSNKLPRGLIVGVATGVSCFVLVPVVILLILKKKSPALFKVFYPGKNSSAAEETNAREFIKTYRSTLLTNYSYHDIKKMTNGFKEKLGEGGYGTVYRGKLFDGRPIAVKMLDKSPEISPDFINEVSSIGRIHHVNVIKLLGFCWDGSKQGLIYEYMPNGSLADLLSKEEINHGMERLMDIALGVAHGIEYLHTGCESRILHHDIKPQNVLLDQNFSPKISDFGLAKVHSRNHSIVTMTGARGTVGYIAPEIFMRNLGKPSHKSDVYSYGMLVLEMVGGRNRINPITGSSSESTYFPDWIYNRMIEENDVAMVGGDFVEEEDDCIIRKMVMVGLWCIQVNPRDRPSITRVVEMLCGRIEDIEIPPKPFSFPSHNQQSEFEITSVESDDSVIPLTHESQEINN